MPIANYTTTMTVNASVEKITKMLIKAGVRAIQTEYGPQGNARGLTFSMDTEWGERQFSLPVRVEGVLEALKRQKVEPRYQKFAHAERVAWRIAHDWLRAQLAIIDAGMTTTAEVFFPYLVLGYDQATPITAYKQYTTTQREIVQ
ncbi:hypothetical protein HOT31_gp136 [Microbacterium phage Hendrix]|uniref:Uncharacterized protein n=1 Tax=Microbacterium phage Hendrix TaxID=2182341 RepID=A0A2U8UUX7_9CAUD|nr:hypothetical protein HOT31_gp136 [Microbacterium phage Hendrix]AWN07806.1 hypothetical protein PBI_HENDRIX_135 [Microbacterium phage Hendrix]